MNNIQKIGLTLGTGALALGGMAGMASMAQAADPTAQPTPAASAGTQTDQQGQSGHRGGKGMGGDVGKGGRHGGAMGGDMAAKLAEKLGVDETKVTEALQTAHDALKPAQGSAAEQSTKPSREDRQAALATELAKALGVDEAKVTEALNAIESERNADRAAELTDRLAQAVTDGKLTQAEADAVKKAVEAGVIGGGGGGPRR